MSGSKVTLQTITVLAGEALTAKARVKIESGTVTSPPEVAYADQGEQAIGVTDYAVADGAYVSITLIMWGGTLAGIANDSFAIGATLYAHNDGEISDTSSGSAIGIALEAATAAGDEVEYAPFGVLSTTAATVSYADAGGQTAAATMEAVGAELYTDLLSAQNFIPIPLTSWMIGDGTNTVSFGGPATDPILDMTNGDTDSALRWVWAAASVVEIVNQIPLPPNLDVASDIVLHLYAGKDADANTVTLASDSYFMVGDTKVSDVTATIAQAAGETIITIAAADVPAGAQTLTIELTPSAHAGDALYVWATWLEYTAILLTS
jgi:hypothetical protein